MTVLDVLEAFYLEYLNNYLTVEHMAEHKGLTTQQAMTLIEYGRDIHNAKHEGTQS